MVVGDTLKESRCLVTIAKHYCPFCRQRLEFAGACPRPGCLLQARIDAYKAAKVPTGREVIEQGDPVLAGILRDTVMATAKRAREDIEVFFEFVMRDFSTREKVKITPHQRVALRFAQDHDRTVNMWPVGGSKTFCSLCLLLFQIGNEPLTRAAVVSASQEQAQKLVQLARDYIEMSAELHLVFPNLRRTQREGEPWTQTALTIDRPPGIKEATVAAYGLGSQSVQGTRLNFVIIDDVLNQDNTMNHEQRMRTIEWVDTSILSRVDPKGKTKVIMTNTPWHPEDIACHTGLSRQGPGWACLQMDVMGDIRVYDDSRDILQAEKLGITFVGWDSPHLRPADNNPKNNACRLVAHDPDPQNQITLWPDRYTDAFIAQKRRELAPHRFNQMYRAMPTSDETSRCKQAYIDACLQKARDLKIENFAYEYTGQYQVYIGLDLAWSPGEENDDTAFFVFEARPEANVILEIDSGQWPITETMEKLFDKVRRFRGAVVRVENNGGQAMFRKFALQRQVDLMIKPHTTEQRAKAHPETGVEGLFVEMSNGAWAFPNSRHGEMHPMMAGFIEDCINYQPSKHTADRLMACYFARAQKIEWQGMGGGGPDADPSAVASSIMSR